eukprot:360678-Chlamydomonas_euryale.AAC.3
MWGALPPHNSTPAGGRGSAGQASQSAAPSTTRWALLSSTGRCLLPQGAASIDTAQLASTKASMTQDTQCEEYVAAAAASQRKSALSRLAAPGVVWVLPV